MDKNRMIREFKTQMLHIIQDLTFDNIENQKNAISQYFQTIELLKDLPIVTTNYQGFIFESEDNVAAAIIEVPTNETPVTKENEMTMADVLATMGNENDENRVYVFERKLRGGFVIDLDGGYYVNEHDVRMMDLQHGDKVKATRLGDYDYKIEIVEKVNVPLPDRIEIRYCVVKRDKLLDSFIIESCSNGLTRVNGVPFTFVIKKEDVAHFRLQEDDVVDIAYYNGNENNFKVIYQYKFDEVEQKKATTVSVTKKKTEKNTPQIEKELAVDAELFLGKKILIVGGMHNEANYRKEFEKLGAEFTLATGDEHAVRIDAMISKADVVAINCGENSHWASKHAVEACKRFGVPFATEQKNGTLQMLLCAETALKRALQKKQTAFA